MNMIPRQKVVAVSIVVKTKCVQCGTVKDIHAGEVAPGDYPMCDKCFMPMVPVSVSAGKKTTRQERI